MLKRKKFTKKHRLNMCKARRALLKKQGYLNSPETIEKILKARNYSSWCKGLIKETDKRIMKASKKRTGQKRTKKWCKNISKGNKGISRGKGKKKSKEHCENIKKALTGKKFTKKHLLQMRKTYIDKERNLKISKKLTGKKLSKEHREAVSKTVALRYVQGILTGGHRNGHRSSFYSKKNHCIIRCASSYERAAAEKLERMPEVASYKMNPCRILYEIDGIKHYYVPDILVTYKSGKQELIEVKPIVFLNNRWVIAKSKAAIKYCKLNNLEYKFWTEKELEL
jgi:hypothetical protein